MSAFSAVSVQPGAARKAERQGVAAVLEDQTALDHVHGITRQLNEELVVEPTLDALVNRIQGGYRPRVLILDLSGSVAPIEELSAARAIGGAELKILALGSVNDVLLFRDLRDAGATDYLVKPVSQEALTAALENDHAAAGDGGGFGQVVAFVGSRGGVGTTTTVVSCAWLLGEKRQKRIALVDLDLHYGTVALKLDTDPGSWSCEALEQGSRIDSLFVERAMVKVSGSLRMLAAEAPLSEMAGVDPGAIAALLDELRRKFDWVLVDLSRCMTPAHRVVLGAATRVVVLCERSLPGLRDTIRLQTYISENAPQAKVLWVDSGAAADRSSVKKPGFEKRLGFRFAATLPYDAKSTGAAMNAGKPLPLAVPSSPVVRELERLVASLARLEAAQKRKPFGWARWYQRFKEWRAKTVSPRAVTVQPTLLLSSPSHH
jgi:pilus assembly protein CpaE